jgi:hypothetical protein
MTRVAARCPFCNGRAFCTNSPPGKVQSSAYTCKDCGRTYRLDGNNNDEPGDRPSGS